MEKTLEELLEYYGTNLDASGEPDEMPEFEGVVKFPTTEEEILRAENWSEKVENWERSEN